MHTFDYTQAFDYTQEHDDTGWWSPHIWPGSDQLMSWDSVGTVIIGAILVLWWGLDDVAVWNVMMLGEAMPLTADPRPEPEQIPLPVAWRMLASGDAGAVFDGVFLLLHSDGRVTWTQHPEEGVPSDV